jgi:release factor glutamine methyltransferase
MKNSKLLFQDFVSRIRINESKDEIESIAYLVFEKFLQLTRTDILSNVEIEVAEEDLSELININRRINTDEPIQYILGEAFFFGRKFKVTPSVLIPRPETEELVNVVLQTVKQKAPKILDIGTGSGCIPITLALEISDALVSATDISEEALSVARINADRLGAMVNFFNHDVLSSDVPVSDLDIVVSNPPYITYKERGQMNPNVTRYEPYLSLFVPNDDPLLFYRAIVKLANRALHPGGMLIVEINEQYGIEVSRLFSEHGLSNSTILKDINGKDRIVQAFR